MSARIVFLFLALVGAGCGKEPNAPSPRPVAREALIAFSYDGPEVAARIGVMRTDGSGIRYITDGTHAANMPAWSPDGMHLSMAYQGIAGRNPQLYTIDVDGKNLFAVPIGLHAASVSSWSPDGLTIAFGDFYSLFLVDRDGSNLRELSPHESESGLPAWSPDGARIAFTSMRGNEDADYAYRRLYVVRPDGSGLQQLAPEITAPILHAAWSPDGRFLVFDTSGPQSGTASDIWIATLATGVVRRLVATPETEKQPTVSPDGQRVAFVRRVGAEEHIFTIRVDGTEERQITTGPGQYGFPTYRPTGN